MNLPVSVDPGKVATYIRWSTEEQSEGTTLDVQRDACRHYIQSQGWEFREDLVYVDDGYSGGTMDRPILTRLRKDIQDGSVTCVVVFKLDRLSRSVIDTVELVLREWEGRCYLKSAREPIDTTTASGKMFFYMLASYAEWERSVIRERTLAGKIRRAQEGKNPGIALPHGYTQGVARGTIVVDETAAAVVRRIFREYLSGSGGYQIAKRLNEDGLRPSRGTHWSKSSVDHILQNPAYTGLFQYGKVTQVPKELRKKVGRRWITFDEPRFARIEGGLPSIISGADFEQAQNIRQRRGEVSGKRALSADYLLSGLARCRCGAPYRGQAYEGGKYRYYRCATLMNRPGAGCDAGHLPAELIEEKVLEAVRQAVAPANTAALLKRQEQEWQERVQDLEVALRQAQADMGGLAEKRRRLDDDYDMGELPGRLYAQRVEQLEQQEVRLAQRIEQLGAEVGAMRAAHVDLEGFAAEMASIDAWDQLTAEQRKQVLRHLVESLTVFRKRTGRNKKKNDNPIEVDLTIRKLGMVMARQREAAPNR